MLDIRVIDTDAQSYAYASRTVDAVVCSAEQEKKRSYSAAVEERRATFTAFVVSVDGVLGAKLAFAMLRVTNLCLRGSRVKKWRGGHGMDDGAGLPHFPH